MGISVVGLGPGDGRLLTREAWQILTTTSHLYLRTSRHPAVNDLPDSIPVTSFDTIYEQAETFAEVYEQIVSKLN